MNLLKNYGWPDKGLVDYMGVRFDSGLIKLFCYVHLDRTEINDSELRTSLVLKEVDRHGI